MPYNWDAPFQIRDIRNGEWYWVQKEVLSSKKINASDKLVYSALAYYANNKTQECFPSYTQICKLVDLSRNTVIKAIRKLIKYKFVSKKKKEGRSNYYELVKIIASAKFAPVPKENQHPTQKRTTYPTQNKTSNNTYINKNKLTIDEEAKIPSKKINPLAFTRGQILSFLKSFPGLTSTELYEQSKLCNNYMGMSSFSITNPGLYFRKWLTRYTNDKKTKQIQSEKLANQEKSIPDLTPEQRERNFAKIKEIREEVLSKLQ